LQQLRKALSAEKKAKMSWMNILLILCGDVETNPGENGMEA